jgi:hypothetical protein
VSKVDIGAATEQVIKAAGKDPKLNWLHATFAITIGGRQMQQGFICGTAVTGAYVVEPAF